VAAPEADPDSPEAIERRVAELERQLKLERALRTEAEGKELKKPDNLPERFSEAALRSALTAGFKELGFKAEVTSIDCTEYPCIAYGEGFGTREDSERLAKSGAMSNYSGDNRNVWGWQNKADGKETFGVALFPKDAKDSDPAAGAELRKRIGFRVRQMQGSTH